MLLKNGSKLVYWDQKSARCLKWEEKNIQNGTEVFIMT